MYTITFYSFKGGVGRTMALVNVAAELVRRDRKVLVVDFDLEAPGLETYKHLRPAKPHPGIVEYVTQFRQTYQVPDLREFVYEAKPIGKKGGRLWVMPAGRRDTAYRRALVDLDWKDLYKNRHGFLLFEDTKKGWEEEFEPDYVLIDSRTGDTDALGICTRQLPDAVVLMFTPNEQNLAGLKNVCRDIRREAEEGLKKRIRMYFVAANVPDLDDEDHRLERQVTRFREKLGACLHNVPKDTPKEIRKRFWPPRPLIIHRNETLQMLDQPVFVLDRPRSKLAREYRTLVRKLRIDNDTDREGALLFLNELQRERSPLLESQQYELEFYTEAPGPSVESQVNRITESFWNDAEVLVRAGQYLVRNKEEGMALTRFNRALELQPDSGKALLERAYCHRLRRDDAAATQDFFRYLGTSATDRTGNSIALFGLLSISIDEFLRTLDLPPVEVPISPAPASEFAWCRGQRRDDSHDGLWLLLISLRLIQEQRWDDAIRLLENQKVKLAIESGNRLVPTWIPLRAFHLAIARWGKSGAPDKKSCKAALLAYEPLMSLEYEYTGTDPPANYEFEPCVDDLYGLLRWPGSLRQDLSLLYWGVGEPQKAMENLDEVFSYLGEPCETASIRAGDVRVSSWSFQRRTARGYRHDCEEMRQMINGEAVPPAFLSGQPFAGPTELA